MTENKGLSPILIATFRAMCAQSSREQTDGQRRSCASEELRLSRMAGRLFLVRTGPFVPQQSHTMRSVPTSCPNHKSPRRVPHSALLSRVGGFVEAQPSNQQSTL